MNHTDRLAPFVAGLLIVTMIVVGLVYGAHELVAAVDNLTLTIGGAV